MSRPKVLKGVRFYKSSKLTLSAPKKKTLATNIFCASNVWQMSTGLMFRKLKKDEAMFFLFKNTQKNVRIHMFCVFHPIDLVFCKIISATPLRLEVKDIKQNLRPFAHYTSLSSNSDVFIEFPAGKAKHLRPGVVISLA